MLRFDVPPRRFTRLHGTNGRLIYLFYSHLRRRKIREKARKGNSSERCVGLKGIKDKSRKCD